MKIVLLILVLLLTTSALAADPEPYLKSAPVPFYPPIARQARIAGKVTLNFVINQDGETSEVEATAETEARNGMELLRRAAIANVQDWRFGWTRPCNCRVKKKVVFVYSVSGDWIAEDGPDVVVKWFGKAPVTRVEIQVGGTLVQP